MKGLYSFLSDRAIELHREHVAREKHRYSVFKKTYPEISGLDVKEIQRLRIDPDDKGSILRLYLDILYHEVFFNSFGEPHVCSEKVRERYGSEASFLYEIYKSAFDMNSGFVVVYNDGIGVEFDNSDKIYGRILKMKSFKPYLAIDLCEHAYFLDYGFNKAEYLKRALSVLDLGAIE